MDRQEQFKTNEEKIKRKKNPFKKVSSGKMMSLRIILITFASQEPLLITKLREVLISLTKSFIEEKRERLKWRGKG